MLEKIQNKHILIDGDIIKYRCAASAEKTKYLVETIWVMNLREYEYFESYKEALKFIKEKEKEPNYINNDLWSRKEIQPLEFALQATKTCVESIIAKLNPSKTSIFLSPARNFRDDLARTLPYKGNRTQPKPKYLKDVEDYLVKQYGAIFGVNVEADDEIGRALSSEPENTVSVSIDKDLLQIPGWHYNWVNDTVTQISAKQGDFNFYTQMLTGDATDNIPGIAGIGPKGAWKLLDGAKSSKDLCSRVWSVYQGEFNDPDKARAYFLEQAQLLYILRGPSRFGGGFCPPIKLGGELGKRVDWEKQG